MKSLIRRRREAGAICGVCRSPDYKQFPSYISGGKLNFKCQGCGHEWQCGYDGGVYSRMLTLERVER